MMLQTWRGKKKSPGTLLAVEFTRARNNNYGKMHCVMIKDEGIRYFNKQCVCATHGMHSSIVILSNADWTRLHGSDMTGHTFMLLQVLFDI